MARREAQTYGIRASFEGERGGRLAARHMRSTLMRYRASRYLSAICARRFALAVYLMSAHS
jgi:hypothetical protein